MMQRWLNESDVTNAWVDAKFEPANSSGAYRHTVVVTPNTKLPLNRYNADLCISIYKGDVVSPAVLIVSTTYLLVYHWFAIAEVY